MNTQLIKYTNPKSLPDGAKLLPVTAANGKSSEHQCAYETRPLYTVEEIRLRVETVTPLLKEILDFRPPEHWGIYD